jgi:D-alanyl-D-alanine carboxypeptidase (penicillin-binding protein 5/6)
LVAAWAAGPEQAVSLAGVGQIGATGGTVEVPIASVTKLMSALVVLRDHPLQPGEEGPSITISPGDVVSYEQDKAADDSVVAVRAGEQLSELQALEAALIPSADNVVDLLARWDAGGVPAFVSRMNTEARLLGLSHTHYTGASGVDPGCVSTASDQVRLAGLVMRNPVIARIVAMPQVSLPVAGLQYNVDADLGKDGIVGIKTGWVPQGGASFVFAARDTVSGHAVTVIGAVVGDEATPALPIALSQAARLVRAVDRALVLHDVVSRGDVVASIVTGRGRPLPVETTEGASFVAWPGARISDTVAIDARLDSAVHAGERIGVLELHLGAKHLNVPLVAASSLAAPSIGWRLGRL